MGNRQVYSDELRKKEGELVASRRAQVGKNPDAPIRVGLALSGGGIRSATFCLGVLQALAKGDALKNVDYLSTVSGGSFMGAFLGRLYQTDGAIGANKALADTHSPPLRHLRENGRYLAPNGSDYFVGLALVVRNWFSLHFVLGLILLPFFTLLALVTCVWFPDAHDGIGHYLFTPLPFMCFVVIGVGASYGLAYWLVPLFVRATSSADAGLAGWRRDLTAWTGECIQVAMLLGLLACVDFAGGLIARCDYSIGELAAGFAPGGALATGIMWFGKRILSRATTPESSTRIPVPLGVVAGIGAFTVWGLIFVAYSVVGHRVVDGVQTPFHFLGDDGRLSASCSMSLVFGGCLLVLLGLTCWHHIKRGLGLLFVNESGIGPLYYARLARAYLGAANPARWDASAAGVADPVEGDDVPYTGYAPHKQGGPLHIINMTLNETVAGRSQLVERDRRGMNFALGPAGVSVGSNHHAAWVDGPAGEARLKSLEPKGADDFVVWQGKKEDADAGFPTEPLTLGRWVSISGAAFTTGAGYQGSLALSLLCGAANVRLGHWWNSGVDPAARLVKSGAAKRREWWRKPLWRFLPLHTYLLSEFLSRFPGCAAPYWYLSDGGHFDNTGVYELLRRRLDLIVLCDDGADPYYNFWDLGNLVRKARIDFRAEIEFLDPKALAELGDSQVSNYFGGLEDLRPDAEGISKAHAAVARIRYWDEKVAHGWLVVVKPTLTGDEPSDIRQYRRECAEFPQQTTLDQFFDEAQWESYRALGFHIGDRVAAAVLRDPAKLLRRLTPSKPKPAARSKAEEEPPVKAPPRRRKPGPRS